MSDKSIVEFIENVLNNMPSDWLNLTTHRLDIYNEKKAKSEFINEFEKLINTDHSLLKNKLESLPTAFDYIRLGHPLSCLLEWLIAKLKRLNVNNVISFSSQTMPILAILRTNLIKQKKTQIIYEDELPVNFDVEVLKNIYGYDFDLIKLSDYGDVAQVKGSRVLITSLQNINNVELKSHIDFIIGMDKKLGSVVLVNGQKNEDYISHIQHVRRRESIAMTPSDCLIVLQQFTGKTLDNKINPDKSFLIKTINEITNTSTAPSIGSSGLSVQYAIMMGLIHHSLDNYKGKNIKFIVPPNCYGGTNDQARRVAACVPNVEVVDLPVDGGQDMVHSIDRILDEVAKQDAVGFIIAEIPTNPRVEVPHLNNLRDVLSKTRKTKEGNDSIEPVFILDQTFCPNVKFLGEGDFLSSVKTISYVSGSKFPSGGLCTSGYCVANDMAGEFMKYINNHLKICDNAATDFQLDILATQMPTMNKRINAAYKNTRKFVNFIQETLPSAKINFVSEDLAKDGFTPSVFSLDLPTIGSSEEERESYKRALNLKLINLMINEVPSQSKFCVSYGQLKGCYWTIPATSTQGTTKEGDKDYIVRVAVSPDFDLEMHQRVFSRFCDEFVKS